MTKLDLKKQLKHLYSPSKKEVSVVDVPAYKFLMVSGEGGPDGKEAKDAIEALYPVAYKIKFACKAEDKDYGVMPLEGLWWADNMQDFVDGKRENWKFTYMIMQPDFVTADQVNAAKELAAEKKELPALSKLEFAEFAEGKAAQIMHIGPFSEEGPNIQRIHEHIKSVGGKLSGKHHEIYLSDFRRVDPKKMKTVLRQPFKTA